MVHIQHFNSLLLFSNQEGEALLEKLERLWELTSIDSRPDFLRPSISRAIGQVRYYLRDALNTIRYRCGFLI
jgi:hypothetical protein